ncbi:hypothetical protein DFP72DRAFT_1096101 [Ephemerocybe angulata]|uniref:Letm1 RBD domain-containing protein n=1 Tax=Ephemerocybe angulata TaxID=980116 RepID=A0A8H6M9J0_9AGAR|nr:hypothetical protein DFP72DRAFT_1096101 [Tulosesus angulatus]
MLRSISRDVTQQLLFVTSRNNLYHSSALNSCRHRHWHNANTLYSTPSTFARRHYTPLNTTPTPSSEKNLPPPPAPKKPKIDLRPGPIKPKHTTPSKSSVIAPVLDLKKAKEEVQKDISEAEKHGIFAPAPEGANWFRATLHKAIELAKFYYRGVKLIFSRRKEIAAIRARIKEGGSPLTRAEYRFIQTQKDDVNKVIPFLIIALLLEEVIPLIAIYAPFMLPSTCILPSQRARIEAKRAEKALNSSVNSKAVFSSIKSQAAASGLVSLDVLKQVAGGPTAVCSLLGLSTLGPDALRLRRIRKHLEFIAEDDSLLLKDQLQLSERDLTDALAERGLLLSKSNSTPASKANLLLDWLHAVKDKTPDEALSVRITFIISRQ